MLGDLIAEQLAGLNVRVLLPSELKLPTEGGRGGSERAGLPSFLAANGGRFVQIEEPRPITSDGQLDTFWTPVDAVAISAQACAVLALEIRTTLAGTGRSPGLFDVAIPALPTELQSGVWISRVTFSTVLLAGIVPA